MAIFVLLVLGVFASVKSDVGYVYSTPPTSYDVPFRSVGVLSNERKFYDVDQSLVTPSSLLQTPIHEHVGFNGGLSVTTPRPTLLTRIVESDVTPTGFNGGLSVTTPRPTLLTNIVQGDVTPSGFNGGLSITTPRPTFLTNKFQGDVTPSGFNGGLSVTTPRPTLLTNIVQGGFVQTPIQQVGFDTLSVTPRPTIDLGPTITLQQKIAPFNILETQEEYGGAQNVAIDSQSNSGTEVQKHLYFFSAPEEPEVIKTRIIAPPTPVKKNVKILFIKAPTYKTAPVQIPVLPQNDEKTLVYVLVKKPEETSIVLPTPAPTKPSKPEVFFIKYKTQKDAEEAVANLQNSGGHVDNQNADFIGGNAGPQEVVISSTPQPINFDSSVTIGPQVDTEINSVGGLTNFDTRFNVISHGVSGIHSHTPTVHFGDAVDNVGIQSGNDVKNTVLPDSGFQGGNIRVHQIYGPPNKRR